LAWGFYPFRGKETHAVVVNKRLTAEGGLSYTFGRKSDLFSEKRRELAPKEKNLGPGCIPKEEGSALSLEEGVKL